MRLNLQTAHQSIASLNADELPDFTVITGPNGSGKTHLLHAIEQGAILVDGAIKNNGKARFFDSNSIVPGDTGNFTSQQIRALRTNTLNQIEAIKGYARGELTNNLQSHINQIKQSHENFVFSDPLVFLGANIEEIASNLSAPAAAILPLCQIAKAHFEQRKPEYFRMSGLTEGVQGLAQRKGKHVSLLKADDLALEAFDYWGSAAVFQQSLGQLFVAYRDMLLANDLRENRQRKDPSSQTTYYSTDEFVREYGRSPWDFVNETLQLAELPFRINAPNCFEYDDFVPVLRKVDSAAMIPFSQLSSGEKVLMSFALCLYQAKDRRQSIAYPEVLLFDEIDAPLHPSMTRHLLRTISEVLVGQCGVKVVLTTHSPTTVALAPESSIYVMRSSQELRKCSKERAVRLLAHGIPTLSVSYDGRRQVLVESRNDAEIFDSLFALLRGKIDSEISLHFIAVSGSKKSEEVRDENGGASVVKGLVAQLVASGNASTYGLIDWDKHHSASGRIRVLAENKRYAIENCLFDPCLIALRIAKTHIQTARDKLGVSEYESYVALAGCDPARMQTLATHTASALGFSGNEIECEYIGGAKLLVPSELLHCNGHVLEKKIISTFPSIQKDFKNNGSLPRSIAVDIVPDAPQWLPMEWLNAFKDLCADVPETAAS